MIKSFDEYFGAVNEAFTREEVKIQNKTKQDIYMGFKNLGYKCLGTLYWSGNLYDRYNAIFSPVETFFKTYLLPMENEIWGRPLSFFNDAHRGLIVDAPKDYSHVTHYSKYYNEGERYEYLCDVLSNNVSCEKVVKIKGDAFPGAYIYCLWNPKEKYYYYIDARVKGHLLDYYIMLKTESLDDVKKRFTEMKEKEDEIRKRYEESEARKREEKERRIQACRKERMVKYEIEQTKKKIIEDFEKHPEKYKKIRSGSDLPKDIKDELNYESETTKYFKARCDGTSYYSNSGRGPLTYEYTVVVNNRELTDGYYYTDSYRPSNYTGD